MREHDILVQIGEIRRQLWLGHASLMVGSGFSRNAEKALPTTPTPPDWIELADWLIKDLYPEASDKERETIRASKNVLQLASEYDVSFQRPALNALLQDRIQDDNLLPSSLHVKMLELPWADVFTTNYDTLLERTARQVTSIKYDIVLDCKDLPYSESPRIIKLHGSFPSEATHLIVSEEDYRTYPIKYSPFVNSVQQAIMESTLCLIGFSGTDPNFLKWIGWVKDNLHNSMPPVYLIGMFSLSASERKVLENKNIKPIDLSELPQITTKDYTQALNEFFKLLNTPPSYYNWINGKVQPNYIKRIAPEHDCTNESIIEIISEWRKQRESYPNWIVLPWTKRSTMKTLTERWTDNLHYLKDLPDSWDINGLYEFNWRLEKCLMPIFNHLIPEYEAIINKYDPFGIVDKTKYDLKLQDKWLSLCFALLRWSREELDEEKWSKYEDIICKVMKDDAYSLNRLYYEQAFHALALPNLSLLDNTLQKWLNVKHPLLWKVKLASFLLMVGEKDKALSLWREALNELRPQVPKSKIKNDFYLLSIEGSILVNLYRQKENNAETQNDNEQKQKYRGRLQELTSYGCNPLKEIENFALALSEEKLSNSVRKHIRDFKATTSSTSFKYGWGTQYAYSFQYLRFFEEMGIPFWSDNTMHVALSVMSDYSPWWAFCMLNVIGSNQNASCELVFSQRKLYSTHADKINKLVVVYISELRYVITNKRNHLNVSNHDLYARMAINLYEVISRLTVKANSKNLQSILDLGIDLYRINTSDGPFFHNLGVRYFARVFEAMEPKQILSNLNNLLSIPIPIPQEAYWEPPLACIDWRGFKATPKDLTPQLEETIKTLTAELDTDNSNYRSDVLCYLNSCFEVNLLSVSHKNHIAKTLRKYSTSLDLPRLKNFYYFAYKRFLAPLNKKHETELALKQYYFKTSNVLFKKEEGNIFFHYYSESDFVKMSKSLLATCSVFNKKEWMFFDLSFEECKQLFANIKASWESVGNDVLRVLKSQDKSLYEHTLAIKTTLQMIDMILGEVIVPRVITTPLYSEVFSFAREFDKFYYLPITAISCFTNKKSYEEPYIVDTIAALSGTDVNRFESYSRSVYNAYRFAKRRVLQSPPPQILNALISVINIKSDITFCTACGILGSIIRFYWLPETERLILLSALQNLFDVTSFLSSSDRFHVQDRYDYRQASTFLAASMYCAYKKKKLVIPSQLQMWYDLMYSDTELPDIRNTWMRTLNNS